MHRAIRRHPLLSYFILAFAISWGGVLAIVGPAGIKAGNLDVAHGMSVWIAMLLGPGISGVPLTGVVTGRAGLRDLRQGLGLRGVPVAWYATLLVAPIIGSSVVAGLALSSDDFLPWLVVEPNKALVVGVFLALIGGAWIEELGWTGYATPRLRLLYRPLHAALLLGALHGMWHFLADLSGRGDVAPALYFARFVIFWLIGLTALRMLMVWAYDHTRSLPLGQLLHASYTAPLFLLTPPAASAAELLLLWTLFTVAFVAVVFVLIRPKQVLIPT